MAGFFCPPPGVRMSVITISSSGSELAATNYWESEHAHSGLCYLSANAGVLRLLVPEAAENLLGEMRTGKSAYVENSMQAPGRAWDIVFDDGSDSPFALTLDRKQTDRAMERGPCRLAVWTQRGKILEIRCDVRTQ